MAYLELIQIEKHYDSFHIDHGQIAWLARPKPWRSHYAALSCCQYLPFRCDGFRHPGQIAELRIDKKTQFKTTSYECYSRQIAKDNACRDGAWPPRLPA